MDTLAKHAESAVTGNMIGDKKGTFAVKVGTRPLRRQGASCEAAGSMVWWGVGEMHSSNKGSFSSGAGGAVGTRCRARGRGSISLRASAAREVAPGVCGTSHSSPNRLVQG